MKVCLNCKKKTNNKKFCSLSCSNIYNHANKRKSREPIQQLCLLCSKIFVPKYKKQKFCSRSCSASFNNKNIAHNKPSNHKTIQAINTNQCLYCHKKLSSAKRYYTTCDRICSNNYKKEQKIKEWKTNPASATNKDGNLSSTIRNFLLDEAGNKCRCGFNTKHSITGKVPLTINHIDGNSLNNHPDNLEVLCPNCHSLTTNYGALNKGRSTRVDRRHKYRQNI